MRLFTRDVDPTQHLDRHLQPSGGFRHRNEFLGNGHRMKHHTLTGPRDVCEQPMFDGLVL